MDIDIDVEVNVDIDGYVGSLKRVQSQSRYL